MNPKFKTEIKNYFNDKKNRVLLSILVIFLFGILFSSLGDKAPEPIVTEETLTADTVIPAGYVLVPIELENAASLSSMIGSYGIVDLFAAKNEKSGRGRKVGARLKLLRAPLNPDQYAVLVHESESASLLEAKGPFFAVIQNPDIQKSPAIYKKSDKRKSRIEYFSEENL